MISDINFLIKTNYGEGRLMKIYVKFGEIGSFIVLSHKLYSLMSKELIPRKNLARYPVMNEKE